MLRDLVLIKRDDPETESVGGVALPDTQVEQPSTGVVAEVGPLVIDIIAGDHVKLAGYAGTEHKIGDVVYLIARESEVLAIFSRANEPIAH